MPTFKGLAIHTWERTWQYIKKAGTIILGLSIVLWAMMMFPGLPDSKVQEFEKLRQAEINRVPATVVQQLKTAVKNSELSDQAQNLKERLQRIDAVEAEAGLKSSIAGRIGGVLEGVSRWAGFDWRINIALVGGFAAKEVVVSTLGTAYSLGEVDPEATGPLSETLAKEPGWSPLMAIGLIVFTMFYSPCFVAVICISRESGSWKWGVFAMAFNTALAFGLAVLVFQIGSAFEFLVK
jgi:ferrous iron transport protein B